MNETRRIYANRACPYCDEPLDPLPDQRTACPNCGRTIHVETGPEGLTYLLRDVDRSTLDAAWADYEDARRATDPQVRQAAADRYLASVLASYRAAGVGRIEVSASEGACAACERLAGRSFATAEAPILPFPGCEHEICRCDYVPVLD